MHILLQLLSNTFAQTMDHTNLYQRLRILLEKSAEERIECSQLPSYFLDQEGVNSVITIIIHNNYIHIYKYKTLFLYFIFIYYFHIVYFRVLYFIQILFVLYYFKNFKIIFLFPAQHRIRN